jgi:formylglycine-generating enzyme required for sulfatase activity
MAADPRDSSAGLSPTIATAVGDVDVMPADTTRKDGPAGQNNEATVDLNPHRAESNQRGDPTLATLGLPPNADDLPPGDFDRTLDASAAAPSPWQLVGLADYELIAEIARGGMGIVYRARQRSLNRIVAVKMILAGQLAGEGDIQRFRSEAEAAAHLQHPNIVGIYEIGHVSGRHFFSMQFVEGKSLSQIIRQDQPSPRSAVECLRTVTDAVEYAHSKGVLHRDLKPSNILVDAAGVPHLTDFGVAKRLREDTQLTATGAVVGTPSYMPPEQAMGEKAIDCRADVYSLGAVLYELLTGRPPFTAQRATDILMQVLNTEPVSPRVLNPSVPADLSTICLKCLEKEPSRRYASAAALSADLKRWLDGVPIEARPIGRGERAWRWCRRNPAVAALAGLLALVAIGAFVGVTSQWLVAQRALGRMQVAQAQRVSARVDALLKAAPKSLTVLVKQLQPEYDEIAPELSRRIEKSDVTDHDRLRLSLALLPGDPRQVDYLRKRILSIELAELLAVREALSPYQRQLQAGLWNVLEGTAEAAESRFASALVLAHAAGDDLAEQEKWKGHAAFVVARLLDSISADPSSYEPLVAALRPVRRALLPALIETATDSKQPQSVRAFATNILVDYAADQPAALARLLVEAEPWQFLVIRARLPRANSEITDVLTTQVAETAGSKSSDAQKDALARRRAIAAIGLLQLGISDGVWPLLVHGPDPRVRSYLIELFSLLKTDPGLLIARLENENDLSARRAILLALGSYSVDALASEQRQTIIGVCRQLYSTDADAGMHSASEWVLRKLGTELPVTGDSTVSAAPAKDAARWLVGPEGHTLAVIDGRIDSNVGSPATEERRSIAEKLHPVNIGRTFAIGTKEVSVEQFRRFSQATGLRIPPFTKKHSPHDDGPIIMVTWFRAAQYCRWLSEQAGVPEDQMCYPAIDKIVDGLDLPADYLARSGFRLPTEAEWEFSCRASSATSRSFGSCDELLANYAVFMVNGLDHAWPCGHLKPNDFGLFDMHGNAWEWCGDRWTSYWERPRKEDSAESSVVNAASNRVLRGGGFDSAAKVIRSAFRDRFEKPQFASDEIGFRVARTIAD